MKESYKIVIYVTILVLIVGFIWIQLGAIVKGKSRPDEAKRNADIKTANLVAFCLLVDVALFLYFSTV